MNKIYSLLLALVVSTVFGQAPAGYYDSASGLTGAALKTELSKIITNGHRDNGYNGLWTAYKTTDIDNFYEKDGTILDVYSENPNGKDPYNFKPGTGQCGSYKAEGDCYNREHVVPQSLFNSASPMVADVHFIRATDGKVNGIRSNYPFGKVGTPTSQTPTQNGSKLGNSVSAGYGGTVFEPIDAFKGDVARMIFYFVTRYESKLSSFSSGDMLGGSAYPGLQKWELDQLMVWAAQDPVSPEEIARNNASYTYQGNRNPYIDHPEWVQAVWGNPVADTEAPTAATNLVANNATATTIDLSWTAATDNVAIASYDIYVDGVLKATASGSSTKTTVTGLTANTTYSFYIIAKDAAGNASPASNTVQGTTNNSVPPVENAKEIFFSEYVEGSGNNKALEISNFTGATVDLSNYSIKKQANGAGAWTNNYPLSGTLESGQALVLRNSFSSFSCTFTSIEVVGAPIDFNGNDPVALFKGNTLIDVIGTFNNTANFAADKTLQRLVAKPNTTYTESEWKAFPVDTCSNLGIANPTGTLSTVDFNQSKKFAVYPNPVRNGEIFVTGITGKTDVEVYSVTGQLVQTFKSVNANQRLELKKLPKGVYIIKAGIQSSKIIID